MLGAKRLNMGQHVGIAWEVGFHKSNLSWTFPTLQVGNFTLSANEMPWKMAAMAKGENLRGKSLYDALMRIKPADLAETKWALQAGLNKGFFSNLKSSNGSPSSDNVRKLLAVIRRSESDLYAEDDWHRAADTPEADPRGEYVEIEVLPTFGGMGGGGTGDGDHEVTLVSRALVQDLLRGKPSDFLLINVRGDSMEPDFRQGDQIIVDKRDRSPAQPGPFAIWDGEWNEYVVKNVERSRDGEVRIFSSNSKYSSSVVESENTKIIGRPVWFGRRL